MADEKDLAVELPLDDGTNDVIRVSPSVAEELGATTKAKGEPAAPAPDVVGLGSDMPESSRFDGMTKAELVEEAKAKGFAEEDISSMKKSEIVDMLKGSE